MSEKITNQNIDGCVEFAVEQNTVGPHDDMTMKQFIEWFYDEKVFFCH